MHAMLSVSCAPCTPSDCRTLFYVKFANAGISRRAKIRDSTVVPGIIVRAKTRARFTFTLEKRSTYLRSAVCDMFHSREFDRKEESEWRHEMYYRFCRCGALRTLHQNFHDPLRTRVAGFSNDNVDCLPLRKLLATNLIIFPFRIKDL